MKRNILIIIVLFITSFPATSMAGENGIAHHPDQKEKKFDADKFTRDQEAYIIKEAALTPQEAASFIPLLREMQQKQRALFKQHRQYSKAKPQNDKDATKLIKNIDETELQIKKIETQYHEKFCKAIPPVKVHRALKALNDFKRTTMEHVAKHKRKH